LDFESHAKSTALDLGLTVNEIVWMEALSERLKRFDSEEYLLELSNDVKDEACAL
jgi:hypothetical protein